MLTLNDLSNPITRVDAFQDSLNAFFTLFDRLQPNSSSDSSVHITQCINDCNFTIVLDKLIIAISLSETNFFFDIPKTHSTGAKEGE